LLARLLARRTFDFVFGVARFAIALRLTFALTLFEVFLRPGFFAWPSLSPQAGLSQCPKHPLSRFAAQQMTVESTFPFFLKSTPASLKPSIRHANDNVPW